jgi:two-component system sensor histidine kinase KdpD
MAHLLSRSEGLDDREDGAGLAADIEAEAERLRMLVEDLLVLGRIEGGRLEVETEPVNLRRLLSHVARREAERFPTLDLKLDVEAGLPVVSGETTYIEQIVHNMLDNAVKYTPPGTGVTVDAATDDNEVLVRVIDDGPGISADSADRLFELFYRDTANVRTATGSGIGLFICASLVRAMGGRIWASRRAEGGSEFGFSLPVIHVDNESAPATDLLTPFDQTIS